MLQSTLIDLIVVLVLGVLVGWLSRRWRFPDAVAQVLLGVLLGGAALGVVEHGPVLHLLGTIGVVVLLGVAGLELGVDRLEAAGWAGLAVAVLGIGFSLLGGYALGLVYGSPSAEAWYLGLALAATSIGISVQVLEQYGLVEHRVGEVIIAAAVIDDVLALYLLAASHAVLGDGLRPGTTLVSVALAVVVLVLIYWSSRVVTRRLLATVLSEWRWAQLVWLLLTVSAGAVLTDRLGLSAVVGAFFAGLGAGDGVGQDSRRCAVGALRPLLWLLVPFFFVMIGVQAQWRALVEPAVMLLLVGLLLVGIAGKAIGGVLGATWVSGFGARWLVGFGMVGRGEVALVVATLGYEQGHISQHAYGALVVAIIGLALFGPLAMARLARRMGAEVTDAPG